MADDVDQGYTWETEYERTWYVSTLLFIASAISGSVFVTICYSVYLLVG